MEQDSQQLKKSQPPERIRRAATMLPPSLTVNVNPAGENCRVAMSIPHPTSSATTFSNRGPSRISRSNNIAVWQV
ncbi:hypothetical protein SLA2020_181950 [Shorea laevis]